MEETDELIISVDDASIGGSEASRRGLGQNSQKNPHSETWEGCRKKF